MCAFIITKCATWHTRKDEKMSKLQEYEKVRNDIGEERYKEIELFLMTHPHYSLGDVYYRKSVWDESKKWFDNLPKNIIYFDTETTGLNENGDDEILSISIIDNDDNVILDTLVKPTHHTSWVGAQRIHGISPEMVAGAPTLEQLMPVINKAFAECDRYCAYNTDYDLEFIAPHLSSTAKERLYHKKLDCMKEFAPIFGEWNAARGDYKWQELVVAAAYYNVEWTGSAHGSLADTRATREVYLNIHPELRPAEKKVKTEVKKNTQSRGR